MSLQPESLMSDERLREIKSVLDAAVPGPWHYDDRFGIYADKSYDEHGDVRYHSRVAEIMHQSAWSRGRGRLNARLIADAPTIIAELLGEVDRLRKAKS